jgi:glycosyltransferase involved in cell wall biosynthesis
MKIAVLVTTYNHQKYIADCANSIIQQSRPPDVVVIADDCSSDNTITIFSDLIPTCIISQNTIRRGPLKNTLAGVQRIPSDVDVVCFIDGDDLWVEDKIKRVEEEFEASDSLLVLSHHHTRVDSRLNKLLTEDDTHHTIRGVLARPTSERHELYKEAALYRRGFWFGSAYSIRHFPHLVEDFKAIAEASAYAADSYFDLTYGPFLIASKPRGRVGYINDITFYYRIHSSGSGNGLNPEEQRASIRRLKAVNLLTRDILFAVTGNAAFIRRYDDIVSELVLHEHLYSNQYCKAIRFLFSNLATLRRNGSLFKELMRTLLIILIGSSLFLKFKNRSV